MLAFPPLRLYIVGATDAIGGLKAVDHIISVVEDAFWGGGLRHMMKIQHKYTIVEFLICPMTTFDEHAGKRILDIPRTVALIVFQYSQYFY